MSTFKRRAVLIVLDGVGLEALPDASDYGDSGAATLPHVARACQGLRLPNLQQLGLGNLASIDGVPPVSTSSGAFGRMNERSAGKDSTNGHWELAGVVLQEPFTTYPQGFPGELVEQFAALAGCQPLGNIPASGISVLKEFGAEHLQTGRPILYTSVDSVFQIAAHEEVLPLAELYELCRKARPLADDYKIGRVIARPFVGDLKEGFRRTAGRKDFAMPPPTPTLFENLHAAGLPVVGVGKISDLFAGRGLSKSVATKDNADGMVKILEQLLSLDGGLLVANLIDFDMAYGHRKDAVGFGRAMEEFDAWLPQLFSKLQPHDLLLITADHGCDPTTPGTDHTREYVPVLVWSPKMARTIDLGTRQTFADVGASLAEFFALTPLPTGKTFLKELGLEKVF